MRCAISRNLTGLSPSWLNSKKHPLLFEYSAAFLVNRLWIAFCAKPKHPFTVDATRLSDRATVVIKRVRKGTSEYQSRNFFLPSLSRNHRVPILETFCDESEPAIKFLVMPILRKFNSPPFYVVSEVVDFIRQTLEVNLHMITCRTLTWLALSLTLRDSYLCTDKASHIGEPSKSCCDDLTIIALYRDCSDSNIMFDAAGMYPKGYHPVRTILDASYRKEAYPLRRRDVPCVRYYFTDFGLSSRFDDDSEPRLVIGNRAQDKGIPELSLTKPYDPFAVDIFTLGNAYRRKLREVMGILPQSLISDGYHAPDLLKCLLSTYIDGRYDEKRACETTDC